MSRFFRGHRRRGSYDLFSSYNHFLPGWGGIFALAALFLLGGIIGSGMISGLAMVFKIQSIPTLMVIKEGKATAMAVGVQTPEQLDELMSK